MSTERGFTLLEVMVALAIFALLSATVLSGSQFVLRQSGALQGRMSQVRQRGVALISVLLVMALALLITGAMMHNHTLMLQSSTLHIHQVQLRQWALAGESWALCRPVGAA